MYVHNGNGKDLTGGLQIDMYVQISVKAPPGGVYIILSVHYVVNGLVGFL